MNAIAKVKERPILFSSPMVKALIARQKTQTRRIVKRQNAPDPGFVWAECLCRDIHPSDTPCPTCAARFSPSPYGQPGDRLIVKEAAWLWCQKARDGETKTGRPKFNYIPKGRFVHYQADEQKPTYRVNESPEQGWRLKIGRYLPAWASRINLEVTGVRVERLQDISEEDARAEGVGLFIPDHATPAAAMALANAGRPHAAAFCALWHSINGPESWDANPWVRVVSFRLLSGA